MSKETREFILYLVLLFIGLIYVPEEMLSIKGAADATMIFYSIIKLHQNVTK